MNTSRSIFTVLLFLCLFGCGGGGGAPGVSVSINPATITVPAGGQTTLSATVSNTSYTVVGWSVQEGSAGGSVTSDGVYTAPTTIGTYHVIATSQKDTSKTATVTINVTLSLTVNPTSPTMSIDETRIFTATVIGSTNKAVTWSVQEGAAGGTITPGGVYTAPSTPGTYHVVATSQADTSLTSIVTATVKAGSIGITID